MKYTYRKKQTEMENCRQLISAVSDGLSHYKLNLGNWVKSFTVGLVLKSMFTTTLNILLEHLKMGLKLITQVNYFQNIFKILINIINLYKPKMWF
jgi:hypothetical protein